MSVGDRILELRTNQNISQYQLSKLVGGSRQAVSKWEIGQSLPDTKRMITLAEALNTDVEYLTTGRVCNDIRPPVVINTIETVEKIVEVPVVKLIEKPVEIEKIVEVPIVQYVEKPVVQKVVRVITRRKPLEFVITGAICFAVGLLVGLFI